MKEEKFLIVSEKEIKTKQCLWVSLV